MVYVLVVVMSLVASVASLFFKRASSGDSFVDMLRNINLYIGGILYVLAALLNIYILRLLDYSVVMPLGAITYVWTLFLSYKVLGERVSRKKVFGVISIIIGAVLVAMS